MTNGNEPGPTVPRPPSVPIPPRPTKALLVHPAPVPNPNGPRPRPDGPTPIPQPPRADMLAVVQREYGAVDGCTCQRCRQAHRMAAEDPRRVGVMAP